jgi:cardiolipin synthase
MIPFFIWQLLEGNVQWAAVILALSGLTDMLDGFLARRFGWVSQLGKFLDPAADKLTQVTVCFMLATLFTGYWPFFAVLLAKELLMLILGGWLMKKGAKLEGARWCGKLVTVLFYTSMTLILLIPALPDWATTTLLTLTVMAAILAAVMYYPDFKKYAAEQKNKKIPS